MTDPTKARCLDPNWKFYKDTDVKRTFNRIRRQLKEEEAAKKAEEVSHRAADKRVTSMKKKESA